MPASTEAQIAPLSNNPPLLETAKMAIDEQLAALEARKAELLDSLGRAKCTNAEEAGKCADLTKQIKKLAKQADAIHQDVKEPYLEAGRVVDSAKNNFKAALTEAEAKLRQMLKAFDDAEQARERKERQEREARERAERERIEAERRAAAEAAKAAGAEAPPPPEPEPEPEIQREPDRRPIASGDYGAAAHRRTNTILEIEDVYALPPEVLNAPDVTEAILKVCRRLRQANANIAIPGLIVRQESGILIR